MNDQKDSKNTLVNKYKYYINYGILLLSDSA